MISQASPVSTPAGTCSVIIPTYLHAGYIAQTIASLLIQSRPPDEIIVVNDGSPDDTTRAIRPFLNRIVYIQQPNQGISVALNRGLELNSSDYLMFLASDDWLNQNAVETLAGVLDQRPMVGVAYAQLTVVDTAGNPISHAVPPRQRQRTGEFVPIDAVLSGSFLPAPASMYRSKAVTQAGGFADFLYCQDWCLAISIALNGWRFYGLSESIANYRRHAGNITRASNARFMLRDEIRMLNHVLETRVPGPAASQQVRIRESIGDLERLLAWDDVAQGQIVSALHGFSRLLRTRNGRLNSLAGLGITTLPEALRKRVFETRRRIGPVRTLSAPSLFSRIDQHG